jgi:hypothetical protein
MDYYVEVYAATGTRVLHTAETLTARLRALQRLSGQAELRSPIANYSTPHSWFRDARERDLDGSVPSAHSNGMLSLSTAAVAPCALCSGTGAVSYSDGKDSMVDSCPSCGGKV